MTDERAASDHPVGEPAGPPAEPAEDETTGPRRRPLRWVRMTVLIVVVVLIAVIGVTVVPTLLQPHANGAACTGFRTVFNEYIARVAEAKKAGSDTPALDAATRELPDRLGTVHDTASGAVRTKLAAAETAARVHVAHPGVADDTLGLFAAANGVIHACAADGSPITLHTLS